ncbi:MAG: RNA-binding protein [Bacteroidales bacterium]|nr:RNA-binding protein [Bacteroidales bacterium]MCA1756493.1 RNA-binding protein [Bacteroidales bacterium]
MNIYVGNLAYGVRENDLKELFEEYGEASSVRIIKDKMTGKSKGFGFVEMENESEAREAISNLNETDVQGRKLVVNEARPRE